MSIQERTSLILQCLKPRTWVISSYTGLACVQIFPSLVCVSMIWMSVSFLVSFRCFCFCLVKWLLRQIPSAQQNLHWLCPFWHQHRRIPCLWWCSMHRWIPSLLWYFLWCSKDAKWASRRAVRCLRIVPSCRSHRAVAPIASCRSVVLIYTVLCVSSYPVVHRASCRHNSCRHVNFLTMGTTRRATARRDSTTRRTFVFRTP